MQLNLPNKKHCTGCSACLNICTHSAITMQNDSEGFFSPVVDDSKCVDCNLCISKCPIINKPTFEEVPKTVYAAYNLNKEQHQKSASGGIFSAFANYFYSLNNGVVCASAFNSHLYLHFELSTNKKDLNKLRGSKYVQSEVGYVFRKIKKLLINGKKLLFLGTPCQVAGLRSYLGKEYDNLYLIDLVCHGVPSPKLFNSYLHSVGINTKYEYDNYYFRNQKNSTYFVNSVKPKGKNKSTIPYNQHSYMCAYLRGWIHRESCYNCKFTGVNRQGDCTISDFWGILAKKVKFASATNMGVSMVMINTPKGHRLFEAIKDQLYYEEKTFDEALIDNHNLIEADTRPPERDFMYEELFNLEPQEFMQKYKCVLYVPIPIWKRIINRINHIIHRY